MLKKYHKKQFKRIYLVERANGNFNILVGRTRKEIREYVLGTKSRSKIIRIGNANFLKIHLNTAGSVPRMHFVNFAHIPYKPNVFVVGIHSFNEFNNRYDVISRCRLIEVNTFFHLDK